MLTRKDLENGKTGILSCGRWANADIYRVRKDGTEWSVKDFYNCPPVIRTTWGKWMVQRELKALIRLEGLMGVPQHAGLLDAFALRYQYIPGRPLNEVPGKRLKQDFFFKLEALVRQMHDRNIVHLDLRYKRNILVNDSGDPVILDFQSSLTHLFLPAVVKAFLKDIDMSGVYKHWLQKQPDTMDTKRREELEKLNKRRPLWRIKGYPMGFRGERRHNVDHYSSI